MNVDRVGDVPEPQVLKLRDLVGLISEDAEGSPGVVHSLCDLLDEALNLRGVDLSRLAYGLRKVVRPDEQHLETRYGEDCVKILDTFPTFDLQDEEFLVLGLEIGRLVWVLPRHRGRFR